jgi:DNA polymerase-3 subunit gamma/tau
MSENLITKFRPKKLGDVYGQRPTVRALEVICEKKDASSFLFAGPAGVGKTTLARIMALELGADPARILEIDAATFTGIDAMRKVKEILDYKPFGNHKVAIILDECHALSKQAWDSLLKSVEDPPDFVIWIFCTTNIGKVPKTIRTRCATFELDPVPEKDLWDLFDLVCDEEGLKLGDAIGDIVIKEANGSPRQLLANISICRAAADKKEAAQLLKRAVQSEPILDLCRMLANSDPGWTKVMGLVSKLEEESPEGIRIQVFSYMGKALQGAKNDDDACFFLKRVEAFSQPYESAAGIAPLMLSIGRVLYS